LPRTARYRTDRNDGGRIPQKRGALSSIAGSNIVKRRPSAWQPTWLRVALFRAQRTRFKASIIIDIDLQ
jgi:hypothetical protein